MTGETQTQNLALSWREKWSKSVCTCGTEKTSHAFTTCTTTRCPLTLCPSVLVANQEKNTGTPRLPATTSILNPDFYISPGTRRRGRIYGFVQQRARIKHARSATNTHRSKEPMHARGVGVAEAETIARETEKRQILLRFEDKNPANPAQKARDEKKPLSSPWKYSPRSPIRRNLKREQGVAV